MKSTTLLLPRALLALALFTPLAALAAGGDLGLATNPHRDGSAVHPYLIEDHADFDVRTHSLITQIMNLRLLPPGAQEGLLGGKAPEYKPKNEQVFTL